MDFSIPLIGTKRKYSIHQTSITILTSHIISIDLYISHQRTGYVATVCLYISMSSSKIPLVLTLVVLAWRIPENVAFSPSTSRSLFSSSLYVSTTPPRSSRRRDSNYFDDGGDDDDNDFENDWSRPVPGKNFDRQRRPNNNNNSRRGGRNQNNSNSNKYDDTFQQQRLRPQHQQEEKITETNAHFFSKKSLKDPSLQTSQDIFLPLCQGAGITRPSRIQSLVWPEILTRKHVLIADQTGSGKTLAYLLPLLQRSLQAPPTKQNGAPKFLILAPTAELADQIHAVCNRISKTVPFQTMVVSANGKFATSIRDQIRRIQRTPFDGLISTPGRLSTILRTRNSGLDLSNVHSIVLDEVDILLIDDTFGPQLRTVGEATTLNQTQFIFVTATLPDSIVETVEKEFPGVKQIRGPGLHRVAPSLEERLVDVSVPSEFNRDTAMGFDIKAKQLVKALRQNKCRRTLIFCNTVESCRSVENLLNRSDRRGQVYDVSAYHNAMTPEARNSNMQRFASKRGRDNDDSFDGGKNDVDSILICTDRAARGVDFDSAPVDHVVVFDFPKDPAEYVRRVGRTARAGRKGTATVFAYGWQLPVARSVMLTNGGKLTGDSFGDSDAYTKSYDKDDNDTYDFRNKKSRNKKKSNKASIKENIEQGRLWDD